MNDTSHRIVVGVDGSPASNEAVRWAARYAKLTGAEVEAVTGWAAPMVYGAGLGSALVTLNSDWLEVARRTQVSALDAALPDGIPSVIRTVVESHPAAALLKAAQGAELLVVGSRGHGGFTGMLLGSVSAHVTAHAPCPVVVVRQGSDAGGPGDDRAATPTRTSSATTVHAGGAR